MCIYNEIKISQFPYLENERDFKKISIWFYKERENSFFNV